MILGAVLLGAGDHFGCPPQSAASGAPARQPPVDRTTVSPHRWAVRRPRTGLQLVDSAPSARRPRRARRSWRGWPSALAAAAPLRAALPSTHGDALGSEAGELSAWQDLLLTLGAW